MGDEGEAAEEEAIELKEEAIELNVVAEEKDINELHRACVAGRVDESKLSQRMTNCKL